MGDIVKYNSSVDLGQRCPHKDEEEPEFQEFRFFGKRSTDQASSCSDEDSCELVINSSASDEEEGQDPNPAGGHSSGAALSRGRIAEGCGTSPISRNSISPSRSDTTCSNSFRRGIKPERNPNGSIRWLSSECKSGSGSKRWLSPEANSDSGSRRWLTPDTYSSNSYMEKVASETNSKIRKSKKTPDSSVGPLRPAASCTNLSTKTTPKRQRPVSAYIDRSQTVKDLTSRLVPKTNSVLDLLESKFLSDGNRSQSESQHTDKIRSGGSKCVVSKRHQRETTVDNGANGARERNQRERSLENGAERYQRERTLDNGQVRTTERNEREGTPMNGQGKTTERHQGEASTHELSPRERTPERLQSSTEISDVAATSSSPSGEITELADEGRKRSRVLPPLESEPSFHRPPKKGAAVHAFTEDFAGLDSILSRRYKKVSVELDRKIVTHLKKKLNKRIEERYSEDDWDHKDAEYYLRLANNKTHKSGKVSKRSIFSKYSDLGEKLPGTPTHRLPRESEVSELPRQPALDPLTDDEDEDTQIDGGQLPNGSTKDTDLVNGVGEEGGGEDDSGSSLDNKTGSGGDGRDSTSGKGSKDEGEEKIGGGGKEKVSQSGGEGEKSTEKDVGETETEKDGQEPAEETQKDVFSLTQDRSEDSTPFKETKEDFRLLDVSPVTTPRAARPPTREHTLMVSNKKDRKMVQGHLLKPCRPESNVIKLYVCSEFEGTEVERTELVQKVFPRVRRYCQQHGYDFRAVDLHWSLLDDLLDDHRLPGLSRNVIDTCQQGSTTLNFMVICGEKYGTYILPKEIPKEEFEKILNAASEYQKQEMAIIKEKLVALDTKTDVDNDVSSKPDTDRSSDVTTDSRQGDAPVKVRIRRRPSVVKKETIRDLKAREEELPDVTLLQQWYRLDENSVPPVYRLQNISSAFKDILNKETPKRIQARNNFISVKKKLQKILQEYASRVLDYPADRKKYFTSAFDEELEHGLDTPQPRSRFFLIKRTIRALRNHLTDATSAKYVDVTHPRSQEMDESRHEKIKNIREVVLPEKIDPQYTEEMEISWHPGGILPQNKREHHVYIERMGKTVYDALRRELVKTVGRKEEGDTDQNNLYTEVAQHTVQLHNRSANFQGRRELLHIIKCYIRSESHPPLVVFGKSGSGKSALLAKTAKEVYKWYKGVDVRIIYRQIASTNQSTNIRTLLRSICLQLCETYDKRQSKVPTDYKGVINDFGYRLDQATKEKPLVIILDAIDRLSDAHDGRKLLWLPKDLPDHVHIIVSTITDDKYDCFSVIKKRYEGNETCLLQVPDLPEHDAKLILKHWLSTRSRTLTDYQTQVLLEAFSTCPSPLFLKTAFEDAVLWTSYLSEEATKLGDTVKKLATIKFGRLERDHGEPLVRRALGYISASRSGLTDSEMEDLLSLDEVVMDDVSAFAKLPHRRIPQIRWESLKADLGDYILQRSADNTTTLVWAHVDFFEAAQDRYLLQRDKAPSYHKALSEYFRGMWAGKCKPHPGNDKGSNRFVTPQPLYFEPEGSKHDGTDRKYNLRKINELPYHLIHSQQNELLKSEALCNFEWILAKLCGTSLRALLEEYQYVLDMEPKDIDFKALSDALHLSTTALLREPRQLASQLIGRLHGILAKDIPATAGDPKRYPFLHALASQAEHSSLPALIPSSCCLTEPGGILFDLLSGHSEPITAVALTNDGFKAVTASRDATMKLWDLRSGKVVKTIEGVGSNVTRIRLAMNNSVLITNEGSIISIWSMRSSSCLFTISDYVDPSVTITAGDGSILVACFYGSNMMRTWDISSLKFTGEERIPGNCIHQDRSILAADNSPTDRVLVAFRSANYAMVIGARSKKVLQKLVCHEESSSIIALAITGEYFILGCRQQYMKLHEIHQLELFDTKKGYYIRSVRGCTHDHFTELNLNLHGSHAIAVCTSGKNNTSDIALWNLETEDHKHLATHARLSTIGACCDFRFCLTAAKDDNTLRIWNLSKKVNQHAPKLKKSMGVGQIFPMVENPRYVVAKAVNHGPISVWNVAKAKCCQTAVRIERGMTETSDVVIARNSKLVILTDRGFSSASDDSKPVFQTVLIYDLKTKRYERKLSSCYIVPAPSHEYVLLDDEHLMGPSENRSHFVVWNLVSGHVVYRIRPEFKEKPQKAKFAKGMALLGVGHTKKKRLSEQSMTPWDLRAETESARQRREQLEREKERNRLQNLKNEKENSMEQFIVSGNQKKVVASFFAHHLCVFDIPKQRHTQTLENEYSMLFLHVAAITFDGDHLVHANYDEESKISYVTLWDCKAGEVKKRLKNESDVCAVAVTDTASRVVIGKSPSELHIWDPMSTKPLKKIKGYSGLRFSMGSKIFITEEGRRAVVVAGDISVWDIENATVQAVFTPDTKVISCELALNGRLVVFGLYERSEVIILKLQAEGQPRIEDEGEGENMFGEKEESSDEEDGEEEGEGES